MRSVLFGITLLAIAGCSGGGGGANTNAPSAPAPVPPPPNAAQPDFSDVTTAADVSIVSDLAILIGDETGILFSYEKGDYESDEQVAIASASKIIFGLLLWDLVESGDLNRNDTPDTHIGFWTNVAGDARSEVTLDQLLGFISGFNEPPTNPGCISDGAIALTDCVETIYLDGLDSLPGDAFFYGPEHMQVAGLMASAATGQTIAELIDARLSQPFGLTQTLYPVTAGDNPRFSGQMRSSADDMARLLTAVLAGDLVSDRDGYLEDRTASVTFGSRPAGLDALDWHYGFGFWKECDDLSYTAACDDNPIISSPGAFGFTPWIDFERGYWGIVAIEAVAIAGRPASQVSVELQQNLQSIIEPEFD